jgi:N-acetylglucosamine-6-sulfatase
MSRSAREALFLLFLVALLAGCGARPNVIVLLTDDQRQDSLDGMPNVQRLVAEGVQFRQAFVPVPVCGPSRAGLLTGLLPSTQGIHLNEGAAVEFDPSRSIALLLQQHGYTTALYGKYLNGYRDLFPAVPPGWNEWRVFRDTIGDLFKAGSIHVDPMLSWDGVPRRAIGYSTDLLADYAVDFIERRAKGPAPFFLLVSFSAPHVPLVPAPRHAGLFTGRAPDPPPSLEEQDLSDKPAFVGEPAPDPALRHALWETGQTRTDEMLLAVDEAVGRILAALDAEGIANQTLVVFTSDNGFLFGEHGWLGKGVPYEASIRVPLVVRYPALARPGRSDALVSNLDLAPTFAALAGTSLDVDGQSIAPLLVWPRCPWRLASPLAFEASMGMPQGYQGFLFAHYKWVVWDDGRLEAYDLRKDPWELEGRLPTARPRG